MSVGFIKTKNRGRLGKRVRSILHRVAMFCIVVSVKSVTQALFFFLVGGRPGDNNRLGERGSM